MRVLRALIIAVAIAVIAIVRIGPEGDADAVYSVHVALPVAQANTHTGAQDAASFAAQKPAGEHICHSDKRIATAAVVVTMPQTSQHLILPVPEPRRLRSAVADFPTPPPRTVHQV